MSSMRLMLTSLPKYWPSPMDACQKRNLPTGSRTIAGNANNPAAGLRLMLASHQLEARARLSSRLRRLRERASQSASRSAGRRLDTTPALLRRCRIHCRDHTRERLRFACHWKDQHASLAVREPVAIEQSEMAPCVRYPSGFLRRTPHMHPARLPGLRCSMSSSVSGWSGTRSTIEAHSSVVDPGVEQLASARSSATAVRQSTTSRALPRRSRPTSD